MNPQTSPILTSRQKRLIKQSFESIQDYSTSLTKLFYGRLFELRPDLRPMFKSSLEDQSRKLLDMLVIIIETLDDFEALRPRLAELGRKHVTYGATPEHYDFVRIALVWALGQALEIDFDPETKTAWNQMLGAVAAAMLEGTANGLPS
jgi:nitric oxide dioxygenase